ncbi:MAG: NTP transferase domain-containing protein [Candidatus Cloacimonetes bacterium]|nr:NTP transferase domain-containing protein [Candidatus Cloacimonadota bacterium]
MKPNNHPITGFILAAGEGTRLRPYTLNKPKALVPICGISLLENAVQSLSNSNVPNIIINTNYLFEQIESEIERLKKIVDLPIFISREEKLLNTGGGLRKGLESIHSTNTILVHNVDIITNFPLNELIKFHKKNKKIATILLIPNQGPCTVKLDKNNNILLFREKSNDKYYTYSGIYIFEKRLLEFLRDDEAPDIIHAMQDAIKSGEEIFGLVASQKYYWDDLGSVNTYIEAHWEVKQANWEKQPCMKKAISIQKERTAKLIESGVSITGAIGIGENIKIRTGSSLHDCIIWDNANIQEKSIFSTGVIESTKNYTCVNTDSPIPDERIIKTIGKNLAEIILKPLSEQGSDRIYRRMIVSENKSYIWMKYSSKKAENHSFVTNAFFLERIGIRVPKILIHLVDSKEILLEDLGDVRLFEIEDNKEKVEILVESIKMIAKLHTFGKREYSKRSIPLQESFNEKLYKWERNYFREMLLEPVFQSSELWTDNINDECIKGQNLLHKCPQTILHRDFQSANIMIKNGLPYFIDFQGMRMGVSVYDVASLLYDPYLCSKSDTREYLWNIYVEEIRKLKGWIPTKKVLIASAVQRLLQALGAYGKLSRKDGKLWYKQFIESGLIMLKESTSNNEDYNNLNYLTDILLKNSEF